MYTIVLSLFLLAPVCYLLYKRNSRADSPSLPPGPPFGRRIPKQKAYLKFEEWTKQYGPVYSIRQGSSLFVVIGRYEAAVEIMEKEGSSLVDRPRSIAAGETLSGGMRILLVSGGERLKKLRRALHAELQPKMAATYEPVQLRYAKKLVSSIATNPEHHQDHTKSYAASVIITLTYGKQTPSTYSDPEVKKINKAARNLGEAIRPGAYLVDAFPILRYVPFYLSDLKRKHQFELELFKSQLNGVRQKMNEGMEVPPCFARYLLENQPAYGLNDNETAYLAGSMFGAGSETTASALSMMMMAAACFPDAQTKVQEELDRVIGRDRCPTFEDETELVQVTAFYLESFRWRPVSINGFSHRAIRDLTWRNYHIPKNANVIGSHWCIFRDPEIFENPEEFDPQRWIDPDTGKLREEKSRINFGFGFGRRICPGRHVAIRSVYINTALVLWAYRIREDPQSPIDTLALSESANAQPLPFKLKFESRVAEEVLHMLASED